ncbi:MBL fold metallo-hydrolase [Anaerococcus hydrogenalis]|uniref:MBL fold metallo-hydrolase n=1 Tax=Anaerococcus hydrogenalis TaxID=33029 RepID=A0A2N6UL27_9FIRM|nr:MBL fold metallo-hydrolase [Anaerococcus hydrogenalis]MDK7694512.1 MBL fold metallo-hydrolase [Anaerococcus hydrogenalis]MDK7696290.1 MBL fold metallo-hydrolase [Anaerococcus hydrogenalis]MDK7707539.1 MBL fold metallo-hydrolase [Anaerococcus hydrogenalis]PMC82552.1 MBL fold metallo-hydrolase [Anaerococcus hydrogenalis]
MNIVKISEGSMMANCYLVFDDNKNGFLIDPVYPGGKIENYIDTNKINIEFILLTHTHFDHVLGLDYFKDKLKVKVYASEDSKNIADDPDYNLSRGYCDLTVNIDQYLKDQEEFSKYKIKAIKTPGHSLDSMSYMINDHIFSGDTLFNLSIGRSDFPGGNYNILINSIKDKLFIYDDQTKVHPGHGESTSIGFEKNNNPFLN